MAWLGLQGFSLVHSVYSVGIANRNYMDRLYIELQIVTEIDKRHIQSYIEFISFTISLHPPLLWRSCTACWLKNMKHGILDIMAHERNCSKELKCDGLLKRVQNEIV